MNWTPEELREMAAADAAIDSDNQVDMDLSRQLDRAALDDRRDTKHLRKLQWQRAYYQAHKETILRQNRESRERTGYKPVRDKEREKARMHDYYERNKGKWYGYKEAQNRRFLQCDEYRAHTLEVIKQNHKRNGARRNERRATDPEYRERINTQKREAYRRRVESDPGYREMLNEKRRARKKKEGD